MIDHWWSLIIDDHWSLMIIDHWWSLVIDDHWLLMIIDHWLLIIDDHRWSLIIDDHWWALMIIDHWSLTFFIFHFLFIHFFLMFYIRCSTLTTWHTLDPMDTGRRDQRDGLGKGIHMCRVLYAARFFRSQPEVLAKF